MSRIFTTGFDSGASGDDYASIVFDGNEQIVTDVTFLSPHAALYDSNNVFHLIASYVDLGGADVQSAWYIQFYYYISVGFSGGAQILRLYDTASNNKLFVRLNEPSNLAITDAENNNTFATSSSLNFGQWYKIEVLYDNRDLNNTVMTLRIDGAEIGTSTAVHTTGVRYLKWGILNNNAFHTDYIDEIKVNDANGTTQNSWPDEGLITSAHIRRLL